MTREELLELHDKLCKTAKEVMVSKNHDYTNNSDDPFHNFRGAEYIGMDPRQGLLLRMQDKFMRLVTEVHKGGLQVAGEDPVVDLINYAILYQGLTEEINSKKSVTYHFQTDPPKTRNFRDDIFSSPDFQADLIKLRMYYNEKSNRWEDEFTGDVIYDNEVRKMLGQFYTKDEVNHILSEIESYYSRLKTIDKD